MPDIGKAYVQIIPSTDGMQSKLENLMTGPAATAGKSAGGAFMGSFGKAALAAGGVAAAKLGVDFFKDTMRTGMEFGSAMSQLGATMDTPVTQLGNLATAAREAGKATRYTAAEAAEALNYMALAGYNARTQAEMLPTVLNLAAAGGMDLALASDMITDSQSALNLSMGGTVRLVDQMAKASSITNTSVAQLGEAMLTVGGNANYMKGGTTELATVLGILADNGIKGSEGGTHLRNMLLSLADPTKDARTTLDRLNVSIFDAEGNMRSFADFFPELKAALADLTSEDQLAALNTIFNTRDIAAVSALLDTLPERWSDVTSSIDGAAGAAQRMADIQMDNLAGDVERLKNNFNDLELTISEKATPVARFFVQQLGDSFGVLNDMLDGKNNGMKWDRWTNTKLSFQDAEQFLAPILNSAETARKKVDEQIPMFKNDGLRMTQNLGAGFTSGFSDVLTDVQKYGLGTSTGYASGVAGGAGRVGASSQSVAGQAKTPMQGALSEASVWGFHGIQNYAVGMRAAFPQLQAAASEGAAIAAAPFRHSVPKVGPMVDDDQWGAHMMQNFIAGMESETPTLRSTTDRLAGIVRDSMLSDAEALRSERRLVESDAAGMVSSMVSRIEAANDRLADRLESAISRMGVYIDRHEIGRIVDQDLGRVAQSKMRRAV